MTARIYTTTAATFAYAETDIDRERTRSAFSASSYYSERRAADIITSYVGDMHATEALVLAAADTDDRRRAANTFLVAFQDRYKRYLYAWLNAESRTASAFVVGPARFDIRGNQKKQEFALNHLEKLGWFRANEPKRIVKRLYDIGRVVLDSTVLFEENGVVVFDNPDNDRIQMRFDGKPSEAIRLILRSRAWNWSPTSKAWQRKRTDAARTVALQIAKIAASE